jgi:hypothetical protein
MIEALAGVSCAHPNISYMNKDIKFDIEHYMGLLV